MYLFLKKENIDSNNMKNVFILTVMSLLVQEELQSLSNNINGKNEKETRKIPFNTSIMLWTFLMEKIKFISTKKKTRRI